MHPTFAPPGADGGQGSGGQLTICCLIEAFCFENLAEFFKGGLGAAGNRAGGKAPGGRFLRLEDGIYLFGKGLDGFFVGWAKRACVDDEFLSVRARHAANQDRFREETTGWSRGRRDPEQERLATDSID